MANKRRSRSVPIEFALCRMIQHAWKFTTVHRKGPVYVQGLECQRCHTTRRIRIHAKTGAIQGASYTYPAGYMLEGGRLIQQERNALRLNMIERQTTPPV